MKSSHFPSWHFDAVIRKSYDARCARDGEVPHSIFHSLDHTRNAVRIIRLVPIFFFVSIAHAQSSQCPSGHQPYGSRCVTQPMADYISCIEASGGNKQELNNEVASASGSQKSGAAKLDANAKIAKGSGSLVLGRKVETKIVEKLESKWFPSGMSECARVLESQRNSQTAKQPSERSPQPKLPIRVTVKAERFEFFPGFVVFTSSYYSGPARAGVELDSPSFGRLHLMAGDEPTTVSISGKHYTLKAESITKAGVVLVLDVPRR